MDIHLQQKEARELLPTDIFFQTPFWSAVKSYLGWDSLAYDLTFSGPQGDILILTKSLMPGISAAYVPQGPEFSPEPDQYGPFLEGLSDAIGRRLDSSVAFIRYDLPWESPYAEPSTDVSEKDQGFRRPEARLQELRMNFGTAEWKLRKAVTDLTFVDRVVVDLNGSEVETLSRMKSKTRYNIRLAKKKGVDVFFGSSMELPAFYELYRQTAGRNHFPPCEYRHFSALFAALSSRPDFCEIFFLLARHERNLLAGAIMAISRKTAIYLFGASSNENRNLMGPYAVHWEAMRLAKSRGCVRYDLGAVSPSKDPDHPYFGLYRFKMGFGGRILHQTGTWDFPLDEAGYELFRKHEMIDGLIEPS
ncbi:lipid II:glycine glycyltransferase FemX [Desulfatiglans anilini]|uniref:lipid II:glycine glycyltransferase FemX n=1 Tax=Desulfatiglans anilini TaxID=90728 RepID=UPI00040F9326|nr:peptidoglycan bridge formation glycyltransferase FemA/FemB family protein [Desulfatiglans anilini]